MKKLEEILKYKFKNPEILKQSLVHRSYLNENKEDQLLSYERIEFLGDAILEFWTSNYIYKNFENYDEGTLTNLRSLIVCTQNLAQVAKQIELGNYILLSKGEESHGGRENISILADTFESIIGAIFLDGGIESVDKFLSTQLIDGIKTLSSQNIYKDPKSIFQEIAQSLRNITPHYQTLSETGPDHQKIFEAGAYIGKELIAKGKGNSKQRAEEDASLNATKILQNQV